MRLYMFVEYVGKCLECSHSRDTSRSTTPTSVAVIVSLHNIHLQMYRCTYKDSLGMLYTPQPSSKHLGTLILCFLVSASSAAAPSDRLADVRIEGIKGEVTVMSKAACFPLSQLRTSTSAGQVWLRSGVDHCPTLPSLQGGHDGRTQQTRYTDDCRHLFYRTSGRRLSNHQYFVLKPTMILFHTANQTLDSLHNDHSSACTTFNNCKCVVHMNTW